MRPWHQSHTRQRPKSSRPNTIPKTVTKHRGQIWRQLFCSCFLRFVNAFGRRQFGAAFLVAFLAVPFVITLSSIPFWTIANVRVCASCATCAQFQLLDARALHSRSLLSATSTTSGTEETAGLLCNVELPSDSLEDRMSKSWSSLQLYLRHFILFHGRHPEWRPLRRVRSSFLRPRRNRRPLAVRRVHLSRVVGRYLVVSKTSEPGTIVDASASGSV